MSLKRKYLIYWDLRAGDFFIFLDKEENDVYMRTSKGFFNLSKGEEGEEFVNTFHRPVAKYIGQIMFDLNYFSAERK